MTSTYIEQESAICELAKAIKGASDPDDAIAKAREAGIRDELILKHLEAAMDREFFRKLTLARAH
jgi:hypothetical protein